MHWRRPPKARWLRATPSEKAKLGLTARYGDSRTIRPEGTRTNSYELFMVGLGKKA